MKIRAMQNSDNHYRYWRCADAGDSEYTNVRYTGRKDHEAFLIGKFDQVEFRDITLPAWRLYEIV